MPVFVRVLVISAGLLLPIFWHSRIQAGDLGSHSYNAWLVHIVDRGDFPQLYIAPVSTNVLFDWILAGLMPLGVGAAERIAVAMAVLIFFWSAFRFVHVATRRKPWFLVPALAMLTYGWTFHMGLFNFYLASGLCCAALSIAWPGGRNRILIALPVLVVAWLAHALPVIWTISVLTYLLILRVLPSLWRRHLSLVCALAIITLRIVLDISFHTTWVSLQVFSVAAVDQVWVFGFKYYILAILLAILWGFLLLRITHAISLEAFLEQPALQVALLTSLGVVVLPTAVQLPGIAPITLVSERMTLLMGVVVCVVLTAAKPLRWQKAALWVVAAVYFSFLYVDTGALDRVEDRMRDLVGTLPPEQRVISSLYDPGSRAYLLSHNIDRVCIAKCWSYGNYEPSSGLFRIRVSGPNRIVVAEESDVGAMDAGKYIVKAAEQPLYQIKACGPNLPDDLCIRSLSAGDVVEHQDLLWTTPKVW